MQEGNIKYLGNILGYSQESKHINWEYFKSISLNFLRNIDTIKNQQHKKGDVIALGIGAEMLFFDYNSPQNLISQGFAKYIFSREQNNLSNNLAVYVTGSEKTDEELRKKIKRIFDMKNENEDLYGFNGIFVATPDQSLTINEGQSIFCVQDQRKFSKPSFPLNS